MLWKSEFFLELPSQHLEVQAPGRFIIIVFCLFFPLKVLVFIITAQQVANLHEGREELICP